MDNHEVRKPERGYWETTRMVDAYYNMIWAFTPDPNGDSTEGDDPNHEVRPEVSGEREVAEAKAKVLARWPNDVCESRGENWFVVGYWSGNTFFRHGEGGTPALAWISAQHPSVQSPTAEPKQVTLHEHRARAFSRALAMIEEKHGIDADPFISLAYQELIGMMPKPSPTAEAQVVEMTALDITDNERKAAWESRRKADDLNPDRKYLLLFVEQQAAELNCRERQLRDALSRLRQCEGELKEAREERAAAAEAEGMALRARTAAVARAEAAEAVLKETNARYDNSLEAFAVEHRARLDAESQLARYREGGPPTPIREDEVAVCAHCELPFRECKCAPSKPLMTKWIAAKDRGEGR